ncbi:phosphatase PAP2 family protein [Streptomyces sp. J2-1]|uniref:phosphatase PAP2 family protein n=1 Tax=Streptomyces corallincola TaxID=2851888 RepID=UPI001C390069|nr:phosphatase PAP2 family protein [Streptomyces corallincola]MBV2355347.1 phosphatase PAP2 family protein [Streptomyces corallincola]
MSTRTEPAYAAADASESAPAGAAPSAPAPAEADAAAEPPHAATGSPRPPTGGGENPARRGDGPVRPPLLREFLLVAGLFIVYKIGRQLATGHTGAAFRDAHRVWGLERALDLPRENGVQSLLLHGGDLVQVANTYYATVHFPATVAFLVWLYLRHPAHYLWARRVLAVLTGAALVLPFVFPLAPPRMLAATGLIDTGRVFGPSVYGPPAADHLSNQFAAMPSLHFGWALMVAIGMTAVTRSRLRVLWLLHPLLTLAVIVGTANHYWLDSAAAAVMLAAALAVVPRPGAVRDTTAPRAPAHRPVFAGAGR